MHTLCQLWTQGPEIPEKKNIEKPAMTGKAFDRFRGGQVLRWDCPSSAHHSSTRIFGSDNRVLNYRNKDSCRVKFLCPDGIRNATIGFMNYI